MSEIYTGAYQVIEKLQSETPRVLVAFSGGKESLCVLDIAVRVFGRTNVTAVHLEFVPGLRVVQDVIDLAVRRHGMEIIYFPHPFYMNALGSGDYCFSPRWLDKIPEVKFADTYRAIMHQQECPYMLTGCRRSDSRQRRILMDQGLMPGIHPLADWSKTHVLAYLRRHDIPLPPQMQGSTTNISISKQDMCWLADNYPADFELFCEHFPFAPAAVHRRTFYGYS